MAASLTPPDALPTQRLQRSLGAVQQPSCNRIKGKSSRCCSETLIRGQHKDANLSSLQLPPNETSLSVARNTPGISSFIPSNRLSSLDSEGGRVTTEILTRMHLLPMSPLHALKTACTVHATETTRSSASCERVVSNATVHTQIDPVTLVQHFTVYAVHLVRLITGIEISKVTYCTHLPLAVDVKPSRHHHRRRGDACCERRTVAVRFNNCEAPF